MYQANTASSQKGEEKIKETCRQLIEAANRRETALLTELRRVSKERQSEIDEELETTRYDITRFVNNTLGVINSRTILSSFSTVALSRTFLKTLALRSEICSAELSRYSN